MKSDVLSQLITMSRHLGDPALDYVILGEGNTSAYMDEATFWVKASGAELRTIEASGFVRVRFDRVLALLEAGDLGDDDVKAGLEAAKVDPAVTVRPSVETVLHALALQLDGVNFVGHTHPTAVNAVLCSQKAEEAIAGRLFPDEIVYCGPALAYVPYTDPGLPLARKVREVVTRYLEDYGERPKVILMQNHGLIALGHTPEEVENITAMYVKAARVLLGTYALGGPHFMSAQAVARIHTRPDEAYRQEELIKEIRKQGNK
jgi:rhamnose utilization protein RhaD (predicted bifunctional aldolase and dehydrogenase)